MGLGCSHEQSAEAPKSNQDSTVAAQPTPAAPANPVKPATPAVPKAEAIKAPSHEGEPQDLYFEKNKDGKVYVVAYVSTLHLIQLGTLPDDLDEKPGFGPDGETVVFEKNDKDLEKRLIGEYQKQHPKK